MYVAGRCDDTCVAEQSDPGVHRGPCGGLEPNAGFAKYLLHLLAAISRELFELSAVEGVCELNARAGECARARAEVVDEELDRIAVHDLAYTLEEFDLDAV